MLSTCLEEYLQKNPPAQQLYSDLSKIGNLYLIGGVLREYRDHNSIQALRDIDIIIENADSQTFDKICRHYHASRNSFNGYKIKCSDFLTDVWCLEDTWAYQKHILPASPSEYVAKLPFTVFLNIDAIIYDVKNDRWNDKIYQQAMKSRQLDIVLESNPPIMLNFVRTFILRRRYNMTLSSKLQNCIQQHCHSKEELVNSLYSIQLKRYNHEILSKQQLETDLKTFCNIV